MLDLQIIGEGATTKIYRDGGTAIKLYINAPINEAENEAKKQAYAHSTGLPVPPIYGVRDLGGGMTALDMAYIPGTPLMRAKMDREQRNRAIHTLAELQTKVQKIEAAGLPLQSERLAKKIEGCLHLNASKKEKLTELLSRLKRGEKRLCHGDFHPLNVLFDGEKYWIIDWVDATAGDPLADACRTYLIFKTHMTRSSGLYLRAFCKAAGLLERDVLAWLPIVAGARLCENMDEKERVFLLEIVRSGIST